MVKNNDDNITGGKRIPLFVGNKELFRVMCHSIYSLSLKSSEKYNVERMGFPGGSDACNAEDSGLIPGWGRSPGEGNGNPLQHSSLENSMDKGASWAAVHGLAKNQTQLSS